MPTRAATVLFDFDGTLVRGDCAAAWLRDLLRSHPLRRLLAGLRLTLPRQVADGAWSAFVSSDLAAVFADTPWLDLPPGEDAQAELLGRLSSVPAKDLLALLAEPEAQAAPVTTAAPAPRASDDEARQFLLSVMRDPTVELALRIDAAKALLR